MRRTKKNKSKKSGKIQKNKTSLLIRKIAGVAILLFALFLLNKELKHNELLLTEKDKIYNESVQIYLCPEENCGKIIADILNKSVNAKCSFFDLSDKKITRIIKNKGIELMIDYRYEKHLTENISNLHIIKYNYLMHNKYCVVKTNTSDIVITGSYNPTQDNDNLNNLIVINSTPVSLRYFENYYDILNKKQESKKTSETIYYNIKYKLDLLKKQKQFFNMSTAKLLFPKKSSLSLRLCFTPNENCRKELVDLLDSAEKSIELIQFSFTDKLLTSIILEKHQNNVKISGLMEKTQAMRQNSAYHLLNQHSLDVKYDNLPQFVHHKVFIVDNRYLAIGSLNPSYSGYKNYENLLILEYPDPPMVGIDLN